MFDFDKFNLDIIIVAIIAFVSNLTGIFIAWYLNNKLGKKKDSDIIEQTFQEEGVIVDTLKEVCNKLDADRVSIYQFHNGDKFYHSDMSVKKISKSVEFCNVGISSDILNEQSLPIFLFLNALKKVKKDDWIYIDVYETQNEIEYGISLIDFLKSKGIQGFYMFGIRDLKDTEKVIGLFTISYIRESEHLNKNEIDYCKLMSAKLTGFIKPNI